jgi:hypothetical protein
VARRALDTAARTQLQCDGSFQPVDKPCRSQPITQPAKTGGRSSGQPQALMRFVNSHTNGPYSATMTALKTRPITIQVHASAWPCLSGLSKALPRSRCVMPPASGLAEGVGSRIVRGEGVTRPARLEDWRDGELKNVFSWQSNQVE